MPNTMPFWTFRVVEKKDLLALRQKARQIAHLLHFPPLEETCIAAGVFAVGAKAKESLAEFDVCFQLDPLSLTVYACPTATNVLSEESKSLLKLIKPLPEAAKGISVVDLGWLIPRINENMPSDLFGELTKQNQEVLLLLHLLRQQNEQLQWAAPKAG